MAISWLLLIITVLVKVTIPHRKLLEIRMLQKQFIQDNVCVQCCFNAV